MGISNTILQTSLGFFKDNIFFWAFQIVLFIIFLIALFIDKINLNSGKNVTRGKESQYALYYIYGIFIVIVLQIISSTKESENYRTILILSNSLILLYLCFFSSWSRNKIIGFYSYFKQKIERL